MSTFLSHPEIPMSQGNQDSYVATQDYNGGSIFARAQLPSLTSYDPFSDLEEDDDYSTVVVDNILLKQTSHSLAEGEFVPPGFWNRAQLDGFTRRFKKPQWFYEMRREAQQILPFLYLGPSSCLKDEEFLRRQGFTLLLAVRSRTSAQARLVSGDRAAANLGIQSDAIDVSDNQELISEFPRAIRRINDHLAGMDVDPNLNDVPVGPDGQPLRKKVFVFCESGNERSAAMVVAYMMAMFGVKASHAALLVQQHRFCIALGDHLRRILHAFDAILVAKRDVERAKHMAPQTSATSLAPPPVPPQILSNKRSFTDWLENDGTMSDDAMEIDGEESLTARKPRPPFQDRNP